MRYTFKLIVAGDGGVGKTTLVDRYVSGTFHNNSRITLGVQFMVKRLVVNNNPVDLQIWDFGGEDRFRFILPSYCMGAHGALFMYDITNPASLYNMNNWMLLLRSQNGKFPVMAAGTKADLSYERKVEVAEAVKITGKYGISEVMEVSSKTGLNVDLLFDGICQLMIIQVQRKEPAKPRPQPVATAPKNAIAGVAQNAIVNSPLTAITSAPQNAMVNSPLNAITSAPHNAMVNEPQKTNATAPQKPITTAPEMQISPKRETWDMKE